MTTVRNIIILAALIFSSSAFAGNTQPIALRVATFNIEDIRSEHLETNDHPRLKQIAAIIQRMRPNVVLLNEIETSTNDGPTNAEKFAYNYLAVSQGEGLKAIVYDTYTPATNTGVHSGFDLDNSGSVDGTIPERAEHQSAEHRAYGNDCFGFGTFPGQYGMALLVDRRLKIDTENIRTFQNFLWKDLPNAKPPMSPESEPWYDEEEWAVMRLSSKTFADVPIKLPNGSVLHTLISHPTPPAFDGPERRNKLRNYDEIALIRAYIDDNPALYDDAGVTGGLDGDASFVILGDLNADPVDGSSLEMTMFTQLLSSDRLADDEHPSSPIDIERLDKTDTARFGLRVDYVLPSADIEILTCGVWRDAGDQERFPSDHFPVWANVVVP